MTPRPQRLMNEQQHQEIIRSDKSDSLSAPVAAKPKEETLYESLLRYHEDNDDDGETVVTSNRFDEEDDRKLPAKPTKPTKPTLVSRRSKTYPLQPFPTREKEVDIADASLYPDVSTLQQRSLDGERFESSISRPPSELRHQHALPDSSSSMPGEYPPPVKCADSKLSDSRFQRMTSFYKSALEASAQQHVLVDELIPENEDEKIARDLAISEDEYEKMARDLEDEKLARDLAQEAEDENLARELARTLELEASQVTDPGQLKIMEEIRKEAERKEKERVLHDSGSSVNHRDSGIPVAPLGTTAPRQVDYLLSQQLAMEEYQQLQRSPIRRARSLAERRDQQQPRHVSFEHYQPHSSDESEPRHSPEEDRLLQQGNRETREAIANGTAHVVQCRGCLGRLHAPMSYALVYCPRCHTVSPGQTYVALDDRARLRRERSRRL